VSIDQYHCAVWSGCYSESSFDWERYCQLKEPKVSRHCELKFTSHPFSRSRGIFDIMYSVLKITLCSTPKKLNQTLIRAVSYTNVERGKRVYRIFSRSSIVEPSRSGSGPGGQYQESEMQVLTLLLNPDRVHSDTENPTVWVLVNLVRGQ
jgi:hypothetical protein